MPSPARMLPAVVHLSHFDEFGGAGRSAYRLHDGLRRIGVRSRMLVGRKTSRDPDVAEHRTTLADRVANRIGYETGVQYAYVPSTRRLARHAWLRDADVVQLANLHGGWFGHTMLPRLTRGKRVVWCIHDMWSFTGHCGYSYGHDGWLTKCGGCPHLDAYPPIRRDATRLNWRIKERVYRRLDFDVVAPSRWLAGLARRSPLFSGVDVHVIPYGVDVGLFHPAPRTDARRALELPPHEPIVLVAGLEPRKGADLVGSAIASADTRLGRVVSLAVAGTTENAEPPSGRPVHLLGALDETAMAAAYAAADVYLLPTRHDNLPNTVLEAMACGTTVVATDVGGIPDVVSDGVEGLLCAADAEALGTAVAAALADGELRSRLGSAARARAERDLTLERQAQSYLELYARSGDVPRT